MKNRLDIIHWVLMFETSKNKGFHRDEADRSQVIYDNNQRIFLQGRLAEEYSPANGLASVRHEVAQQPEYNSPLIRLASSVSIRRKEERCSTKGEMRPCIAAGSYSQTVQKIAKLIFRRMPA